MKQGGWQVESAWEEQEGSLECTVSRYIIHKYGLTKEQIKRRPHSYRTFSCGRPVDIKCSFPKLS